MSFKNPCQVFLIHAKPHKTCVVRTGSTLGRTVLALKDTVEAEVSVLNSAVWYRNPMGRQGSVLSVSGRSWNNYQHVFIQ
jgi:hypothetical protein